MTRLQSALQSGLALLAITGLVPFAHAVEPLTVDTDLTLAEVTTATLAHSPENQRFEAQRAYADALGQRAGNPLDGPPSVGFSHQSDALGSDTGMREWQGSVELPLRRPGLQAAAERQAEGRLSATEQQSTAWRLQIAGQVRQLLARLAEADAQVTLAERALATTEELQAQIKKRLDYGDVPRTHLLLAREETLQRQADLRQAELDRAQVAEEYRRVTGLTTRPADWTEAPADAIAFQQHPALLAAQAEVQAAEADRAVVRERGRSQPTVGMNIRREENGRDAVDSVGISLSLPIQLQSLRAPEEGRANVRLAEARSTARVTERQIRLTVAQAEEALAAARMQLEQARAHRDIADESLALARRGYSLGEFGLTDLLRVQTRQLTAQRRAAMSRVRLQRSIAEYNQAKGIMP
ncbi:TolC family protein [Guyparkeria sp. GHLCS8-2]|uniref:TolC family protein n=1 Tax=Guyparkeria halopsychrophila TaxID=3139421 RepID=UPI0037C8DC1B